MRNIYVHFFIYFVPQHLIVPLRTGKMTLKINGFALLPTQRLVDVLHDGDEVTMSGNSRTTPWPVDIASPAKAPRTCSLAGACWTFDG